MDFEKLMLERQSCRAYDPSRPVSREDLTACLEAARTLHRKYATLPPREARSKLSQALARRGFGWDAIQSAVEQIIDEFED